jgi:exosome complex component RRP46
VPALLSTAMPLAMTVTSTLLALMDDGKIIQYPTIREIQQATSIHVLAFTSHGELLVDESEGDFSIDDWDLIFEKAQRICCGTGQAADVDAMLDEGEEGNGGLTGFLRSTLKEKVTSDLKWRK